MIRRVLIACGAEWTKYSRMPLPYVGLALVIGLTIATLYVHPIRHDDASDFAFIGQAVPAALNLAGFLLTLIYSAALVSGEVASGTIRTVLVRPIQRHELLVAKLLNGMAYTALLAAASIVTAWICGAAFGELSGVSFGDELMYTTTEIYGAIALAALLNLMPHFAAVAYAVFVSTATSRPAASIGIAVGAWLLVDYVKHSAGASAFVFTSYLDQAWMVFQDRCNALDTPFFPEAIFGVVICFAWFVVFNLASIFIIGRRSFGP
jgi:ABC-type transport system involved in multi-copper enzyme maturation permease subunit